MRAFRFSNEVSSPSFVLADLCGSLFTAMRCSSRAAGQLPWTEATRE